MAEKPFNGSGKAGAKQTQTHRKQNGIDETLKKGGAAIKPQQQLIIYKYRRKQRQMRQLPSLGPIEPKQVVSYVTKNLIIFRKTAFGRACCRPTDRCFSWGSARMIGQWKHLYAKWILKYSSTGFDKMQQI